MLKIALVGNPNAGKSTLFNSLTGQNRKVGNWHGVTVDGATAPFYIDGDKCFVTDLPGLYTVKGSRDEELVAEKFLLERDFDAIAVICEAKTLRRSARLVNELKEFKKPIILFVNLCREFRSGGGNFSVENLSRSLGVPVFAGEATDKRDVDEFKTRLYNLPAPTRGDGNDEYYTPAPIKRAKKIGLNPIVAYTLVAATIFAVFYLAFGKYSPGSFLSESVNFLLGVKLTEAAAEFLAPRVSPFSAGLVTEGIIGGLSSVLAFLPQIAVLTFCLDLLDTSGFLSYASAVTDGILNKVGLSGRAAYTLASGFGCTALACSASLSVDDENVRKRAVLSLPFVSCSARTPVYTFIAVRVFGRYAFVVLAIIYLLSAVLPALWSLLLYKTVLKIPPRPTIAEIASVRIPNFKAALNNLLKTLKQFIIKLGTVILIASVTAYILRSVSLGLEFLPADRMDESCLAKLSGLFSFMFKPMGISDWRYSAAMLSGLFAKEGIASCLALLFPDGLTLNLAQAAGIIAFSYCYTPCVTALSAMKRRLGTKTMLVAAVVQFAVALAFSYVVYFVFGWFI